MSEAQLALPGVLAESAVEWVWCEETDEVTDPGRFIHTAVMAEEVVQALDPHGGGTYVDFTVGAGGHAEAILEAAPDACVIGFDRDTEAIEAARARLDSYGNRVTLVHANFATAREELTALGMSRFEGACVDLGVSSPQLDEASRGMSFRREGPIDMRMDQSAGETALELLERVSDEELADVLYRFGEEHRSRRIARSIKRALREGDLRSTLDLRRAVVRAVGPVRVGGVDPATRTFQALRIAVNGELEALASLLADLPALTAIGGTVAVVSFHSLEDRLVKRAFLGREWAPLWRRPRLASDEETATNPRARSAKLRAARRQEVV